MMVGLVLGCALVLLVAYRTYGRLLGRLLRLDDSNPTPAVAMRDDVDYAPLEPSPLLSQHFSAIAAAGPGLSDILWRIVCAGEGMREAETALGWPARAGKLVLTLALIEGAAAGPSPLLKGWLLDLSRVSLMCGIVLTFSRTAWLSLAVLAVGIFAASLFFPTRASVLFGAISAEAVVDGEYGCRID